MSLITEADLRNRVLNKNVLVRKLFSPSTQIRGCSVDLTIGEIYVPGTAEGQLGSSTKGRSNLTLEQGHTAVIRTHEEVALTAAQAAVVFPTSSVSLQGLLMTNPGHVDPGYLGHLHVTVINFGSKPYPLQKGGRLLRALFFEQLDLTNKPLGSLPNPITEELLQRLSVDFLDIEKRTIANAQKAVEKAERKTKIIALYIPITVAIIGAMAAYLTAVHAVKERVAKLEGSLPTAARLDGFGERISKVEALVPAMSRLDILEQRTIPRMEDRVKQLEDRPSAKKAAKAP